MKNSSILPYFHPTTVLLVDDSSDFLSNLSLQLDAALAYRLYDSPVNALGYLNNSRNTRSLSERFFATIKDNFRGVPTEPILRLDLAAIQQEVRNTERFAETSVVIVDYAMPQMDGIEFCQQIDNPHIKKVLFTGVADEEIAVRAFNTGVIDRFIRKNERDVYEQVNIAIQELQTSYIREIVRTVSHVLSLHSRDHHADPAFVELFDGLQSAHGFIEYYMATEPNGFLLLDADGHAARLVILTDDELALHAQLARNRGAPQELLDALASGDNIPYFKAAPDGHYRPEYTNWRDCMHPAQILEGNSRYHWALVPYETAPATGVVASYNGYLDWLDTISYSLF